MVFSSDFQKETSLISLVLNIVELKLPAHGHWKSLAYRFKNQGSLDVWAFLVPLYVKPKSENVKNQKKVLESEVQGTGTKKHSRLTVQL